MNFSRQWHFLAAALEMAAAAATAVGMAATNSGRNVEPIHMARYKRPRVLRSWIYASVRSHGPCVGE